LHYPMQVLDAYQREVAARCTHCLKKQNNYLGLLTFEVHTL
jgi:hypothetical protein